MGRANNQMVTSSDLAWMVSNEDFILKNSFVVTNKAFTKAECSDALFLDETGAEWISWASNRLVPYRLLVPAAPVWVGVGAICEDGSSPVDNPPTAPTIVSPSKTTNLIDIDWTANPGTDDNGIKEYRTEWSSDNIVWNLGTTTPFTSWRHTGLTAGTTYYYRVYTIDTVNQLSPASNVISVTTSVVGPGVPLTLHISDQNTAADEQFGIVSGPDGDTVRVRLTVTSGSNGTCSKKWLYLSVQDTTAELIDGSTFPSFPQVFEWDYAIADNKSGVVAQAHAYRTYPQVGFEATTTATIELISTTGVNPLPPAVSMNINATGAIC